MCSYSNEGKIFGGKMKKQPTAKNEREREREREREDEK
jgi:hypothetical protein